MELRQLRYLVAVVEEDGFTRAADRLHVAQPGISAQVRALERELGQPLLDRSGRRVRLTAAGAAVLPHARAALAAVEAIRLGVDELAGLLRGRVAVGSVVGGGAVGLAATLAAFHRAHPGVEISLQEDGSDRLQAGLLDGRYDVALVGLAGPAGAGIEARVVVDARLLLAVGPEDRWAGVDAVEVAALRERTLVSLPAGTGGRGALERACAAAGFAPRVGFESGDPAVLADLVEGGLGVALLPASLVAARPGLHGVALEPEVRSRLLLAWRSGGPTNPPARALLAHLREALPAAPVGRG